MSTGISEAPSEGESTLTAAVKALTRAVQDLQDLIQNEYPKRNEIERDFVSKYHINRKRKQLIFATVAGIILSYFFTMGTVSYCFLQGQGTVNEAHQACYLLPGYGEVVKYSKARLEGYENLIERSLKNEQQIINQDNRIEKLEEAKK